MVNKFYEFYFDLREKMNNPKFIQVFNQYGSFSSEEEIEAYGVRPFLVPIKGERAPELDLEVLEIFLKNIRVFIKERWNSKSC